MVLTERQQKWLEYIKDKHGSQVRKYTGEPYWNHLISVAEIASKKDLFNDYFTIEIALGHDLLEDIEGLTKQDLVIPLYDMGYRLHEINKILPGILYLTDVFVKKDFPDLNRQKRKQFEAERLGNIPFFVQTIKYADLIDNAKSILEHDKDFAGTYLKEKKQILSLMKDGDFDLYLECCAIVYTGLKEIFPQEIFPQDYV